MRCPNCGEMNEPEARFCFNCGTELAQATTPEPPEAVPTTPAPAPPQQTTPPAFDPTIPVWPPLQDELATLVADARLVVAERSGHYIQLDEPELVIEATRQVVEAIRDPSTWTT